MPAKDRPGREAEYLVARWVRPLVAATGDPGCLSSERAGRRIVALWSGRAAVGGPPENRRTVMKVEARFEVMAWVALASGMEIDIDPRPSDP